MPHRGEETTVTCVVCSTPYTYRYKTGAIRILCESQECHRVHKSRKRAKQRANKLSPPDYPWNNTPESLTKDEAKELADATDAFTARRRTSRSFAEDAHYSGGSPDAVAAAEDQDEGAGDIPADGEGGWPPRVGNASAVFGEAKVCLDDYREVDTNPYRLIPEEKRDAVREWFRSNDVERAGLLVDVTRGQHPITRVLGSEKVSGWDGTTVPKRITRRWCSENALPALEPFAMSL